MQNLNKKAVGESIATFVLILVAVGAVMLAGYSILNLMSLGDLEKSPEFKCLSDQFNQNEFDKQARLASVCFNQETSKLEVTVQTTVLLDSLTFELGENANLQTFSCGQQCGGCQPPIPNSARTYYMTLDKNPLGENLNLYVDSCLISTKSIPICFTQ